MDKTLVNTFAAIRGVIARPGTPTASHALAMARAAIAAGRPRYGRPHASRGFPQSSNPQHVYCENPAALGFRHIGDVSSELDRWRTFWQSGKNREGFITDPFGDYFRDGDGLVWGAVYQLPARDGVTQFVAGYVWGNDESGVTLDLSTIWKGAREDNDSYSGARDNPAAYSAARGANRMAESMAEREREYQAAWQCGRAYEEAQQEIKGARESLRELLRERRAAKAAKTAAPAICAAIESTARGYLETIREARETMRKALNGEAFGLYAYLGEESHKGAFCEAAGLESFPA